jgi:hypothetical protein
MSYNGSGTFQINTTGQPVVAGTVISSTAFNALTADLATGLSTAITKDGQTATTARIPFAQGISSTLVTDSSSVSTGSIITAGGVGIAKNLYVGVNANIAGTLGVTGVATFSAAPIYSSLTASSAVATDASKNLVSVTNTGTGNNVLATSPTLVTPILGTPQSGTLTNATGLPLSTGVTGTLLETNGGTGTTTGYYGFKNRIINGGMGIWQRATSQTFTNALVYGSVDRWVFLQGGGSASIAQTQSTSVPTGFQYAIKQQRTAASTTTGTVYSVQEIETVNCYDLAGQAVTLSFWAKCGANFSASGSTLTSLIYQGTGVDQGTTSWISGTWTSPTSNTQSNTLTTSYQKFTQTVTLGASTTELVIALQWVPVGTAGADDSVFITGVQLEKGSTATSFDYRPYGTELALCQRYFYKIVGNLNPFAGLGSGVVTASTTARAYIKYPVNARTSPTISFGGTVFVYDGGNGTVTSVAINAGDQSCSVDFTCSGGGLTTGRGCVPNTSNASTDFLQFSAEL